ncbi:MAG: HEAT repeat domain-containing protein [Burkholderiaceae bacterium]|nr:HEAT repeat domain-containing protein [Microbacteriaceae bacterium]
MRNNSQPQSDVPIDQPTEARIAAAVARYGADEVVTRSIALMGGANAGEDFLLYVGGRHAQGLLDGAPPLYWPELWGARALLHVWNQQAVTAVIAGLDNQAWRVREMCARVALERELHVATKMVELTSDEVPRVRAAAAHAIAAIGTTDHLEIIAALLKDPEKEVRRAAQQSRDALQRRVTLPGSD